MSTADVEMVETKKDVDETQVTVESESDPAAKAEDPEPAEKDEKKDEEEPTNKCDYITVIVIVFCSLIFVLLVPLLIYYLAINTGEVVTYYIAIEEVDWTYSPGGNLCGAEFDAASDDFNQAVPGLAIGGTYRKARYVQYTDESFTNKTTVPDSELHLGLLGPTLRAEVGQTLRVFVRNNAAHPFSVNPWGLRIAKASEGAGYEDHSDHFERFDDAVAPLAINQYTCSGFGINVMTGCSPFLVHPGQFVMQDWPVTTEAGPQDGDGGSVMWLYTSDVGGQIQPGISAGLVGAIIISDSSSSVSSDDDNDDIASNTLNLDAAVEFVNVFLHSDENESPYLDENMWRGLVQASYGDVADGWVSFGFLDQAEVLRALYRHAAGDSVQPLDYTAAEALVASSISSGTPVASVDGVTINVQFTDPENNPVDTNAFDPSAFNGLYGDGAAQQVVHALFKDAVAELKNNEDFQRSNRVQTINGLAFCNQPGLDVDASALDDSDIVRFYTSAVGGGDAVHVPSWSGDPSVGASSAAVVAGATSVTDIVVGDHMPGSFVFQDGVSAHAAAGARSNYSITGSSVSADDFFDALVGGVTRTYYLVAEQTSWSYAPAGASLCAHNPAAISGSKFVLEEYQKYRFLECMDAACASVIDPDPSVGILGPTLRVEEGQSLKIVLHNRLSADSIGLTLGGLVADPANAALEVTPGSFEEFTFAATAGSTSSDGEYNSRAWAYHATDSSLVTAGLMGGVIVVSEGETDSSTGLPTSVAQEYVLAVSTTDENASPLIAESAVNGLHELRASLEAAGQTTELEYTNAVDRVVASNQQFAAANKIPNINGRSSCTLQGLDAAVGDNVRFHILTAPTDPAVHSVGVTGHALEIGSHNMQAAPVFPGSSVTFELKDVVFGTGSWEIFDAAGGPRAALNLSGAADTGTVSPPSKTRQFFVAADEVEWEYAPAGYNKCQFTTFESDEDSAKCMVQGPHRIGSAYIKAQYRRYTDDSFEYLFSGTASRANAASRHLGILGPIMTVEVGDMLEVHFKNNLRFPANFVPNGPFASTAVTDDYKVDISIMDPVAPGATKVYRFLITSSVGPEGADATSIAFSYSANIYDEALAITPESMLHAGLIGAVVVVEEGAMKASQSMPTGIEKEFIVAAGTMDENLSPYIHLNARKYADDASSIDFGDVEFQESNRMHHLNGFMYCNGEGWLATLYQRARFYILPTDSGIHSLNLHGHSLIDQTNRQNSFGASVFAGGVTTADVVLSSPGDWLLESSIASDTPRGAQDLFTVHPLVTQFFKQVAPGFAQRDSTDRTNYPNSVAGPS